MSMFGKKPEQAAPPAAPPQPAPQPVPPAPAPGQVAPVPQPAAQPEPHPAPPPQPQPVPPPAPPAENPIPPQPPAPPPAPPPVPAQTAAQLPAAMADALAAHSGMGLELVSAADRLVPRKDIIQKMSFQMRADSEKYIPNAQEGMICDTETGELYGEIHFLPVAFLPGVLEFAPRGSRRSFIAFHTDLSVLSRAQANQDGKLVSPAGNNLVEAKQFFGFQLHEDGRATPAYISMKSTQIRVARVWLKMAGEEQATASDGRKFNPPLFYRSYRLGTKPASNDLGSWFGWTLARDITLAEFCQQHGIDFGETLDGLIKFNQSCRNGLDSRSVAASETADAEHWVASSDPAPAAAPQGGWSEPPF